MESENGVHEAGDNGSKETQEKDQESGEQQESIMDERGSGVVGKKQMTLSELGFQANKKKVRTEHSTKTSDSELYTFELAVKKYVGKVTESEGIAECIK